MAATIHRLRTRADRLREEQAAVARQFVLELGGPDGATRAIVAEIDRQTISRSGWRFVMVGPVQNAAVVEWLAANSKRAMSAVRVWTWCLASMRLDTQEVTLSREELAAKVGISPGHVSEIMGELVSINAVIRRREKIPGMRGPGVSRYFLNADIATHLSGAARDAEQAKAAPLLAVVEGGAP